MSSCYAPLPLRLGWVIQVGDLGLGASVVNTNLIAVTLKALWLVIPQYRCGHSRNPIIAKNAVLHCIKAVTA